MIPGDENISVTSVFFAVLGNLDEINRLSTGRLSIKRDGRGQWNIRATIKEKAYTCSYYGNELADVVKTTLKDLRHQVELRVSYAETKI